MTRLGLAIAIALLASGLATAPASAQTVEGFGLQAERVASSGGCKNIRTRSDGGQFAYSGLVCDLQGQRINVLTFKTKREEEVWLTKTCRALPKQWVTVGYGFVLTARNGNRAAAKVGERVYRGADAYMCSDLLA